MYYSPVGQILKRRYEILQLLNSGSLGQTYLARDLAQPARPRCAVKYYVSDRESPNLLKTSRRIFVTEAETLKKLGYHAQIPRFLDCFEENQGLYLVQELIIGHILNTELALLDRENPRDREAKTIYFLRDILGVLDFIHAQGIVHCDIKPNNILRRTKDGRLVLIDFGAARPVRRQIVSTAGASPAVAVSPSGYLAPEQLIGQSQPASDIYAAGIVAIQMLTGLDPAKLQLDLTRNEIQWQHLGHYSYRPELADLLAGMTRYRIGDRYISAREVLADLQPLLAKARDSVLQASSHYLDNSGLRTQTREETAISPHPELSSKFIQKPTSTECVPDTEIDCDEIELPEEEQELAVSLPYNAIAPLPSMPLTKMSSRSLNPSLMGMLVRMGVLAALVNTFAIALGLYTLADSRATDPGEVRFAKAQRQLHQGKFEDAIALARTIAPDSPAYEESQKAIAQWQQEWNAAALHFDAAREAREREDWQTAINEAALVPAIEYWQKKLKPLRENVLPKAENEAEERLKAAFERAAEKDFTAAIAHLKKISPHTSIGAKVQPKLTEYGQKQQIRAMALLQQAYDLAADRHFAEAIKFLKVIPPNTPAGAIAKEKQIEYTQKQKIRQQMARTNSQSSPQQVSRISTSFSFPFNPGDRLQEIAAH
ncbi:MAG: serine/threonine protein kinase [Cyanobacteria bacterium SBLK]|nr:serine/threonine protein kinase [Cyanobacteria bacterium SBLK]